MSPEATIKSQARGILKRNFVPAIMALLILLLPFYIIDGTTTAISCGIINTVQDKDLADTLTYSIGYPLEAIFYILMSPLINGYIRAFYKATYSNRIDLKDVIYYFSKHHYGSALHLNLNLILRMLIPIILFYSPVIIFDVLTTMYIQDVSNTVLYTNAKFLFMTMSTFIVVLYSLRYFTVFTVSADNPQFSTKEVFAYNKKIMKNNTNSAAKLIISFIPWMLLCLLILPMLYVIPYITQSRCVSAKWLTQAALEEK